MTRRLSGLDSAMLAVETASSPMHVCALAILEPSEGRAATWEEVRARLAPRLHRIPAFRRHLQTVPLGLDHPHWIDGEIDIDAHLRRIGVPTPGSLVELAELTGTLAALPLAPERPLWEFWVIEGLKDERTAILAKMHHCLIDGVAGTELLAHLLDDNPEGVPASSEEPRRPTPEPVPSRAGLLVGALGSLARKPFDLARETLRSSPALIRAVHATATTGASREDGDPPADDGGSASIGGAIGSRRCVAFAQIPLDELRSLRLAYGVKLNDIVLAALAGALRRHLEERGGPAPSQPMTTAVPVSTAPDDEEHREGNRVSAMRVALPVHLADPASRVADIARSTLRAKHGHRARGGNLLARWAELTPPALLAPLTSLYSQLDLADHHRPIAQLVVSNVRGPDFGLYCAGHRVESCYPLGPIFEGVALNATVFSYDGDLHLGLVACPEQLPDLGQLARGFAGAVAELRFAVEPQSRRRTRRQPTSPKSSAPPVLHPLRRADAVRSRAVASAPRSRG